MGTKSMLSFTTDRLFLSLDQHNMPVALSDVAKNANLIAQERATQPRIMQGHASSVLAAAFFKDGRRVVTSSSDKTLRIWDVQTGASVGAPFKGHKGWVRSVAISPNDRSIASGGEDKNIILWDVENKQKIFDPLVKHTRDVNSLCFSPDGKRLASGSSDCTVVVWDVETGAVFTTLRHDNLVLTVAFSPMTPKFFSSSTLTKIGFEALCGRMTASNLSPHRTTKQSSFGTRRTQTKLVNLALVTLPGSIRSPFLLTTPSSPLHLVTILCGCGVQKHTNR